jgi:hypothetical protein
VAVSGKIAYVADGQFGLKIVDVADPTLPLQRAGVADAAAGAVRVVAVVDTLVAFSDGHKIQLLDAANPTSPVLKDTYNASGYVFDLSFVGARLLAAAGGAGLLILDASGSKLSLMGSYRTPGPAYGVSAAGANAAVAVGNSGWLILNIALPSSPSLVGSFTAQGPVFDLALAGNTVSLADGGATLRAMDVTSPLTPVSIKVFAPLVRAMKVAVAGAHAYVAEDEAGMAILNESAGATTWDTAPSSWLQAIVDANIGDSIRTIADVLPDADFDGDGLSNIQEFIAGTSPTDPSSVFAISNTGVTDDSQYVVRWHSVSGKFYNLYKSTNLMSGFSALKSDIEAVPPINSYTDTVSSVGTAYYMIGAR